MTTLMPILAAAWKVNRERALRLSWLAAEYLTIASLGGLAASLVVARPVTVLLYGADFAHAAPALPVLAGAFVFICFGALNRNLVLIAGLQPAPRLDRLHRPRLRRRRERPADSGLGFMGAAWMTLVTEAAVVIVTAATLHRQLRLASPPLGRRHALDLPRWFWPAGAGGRYWWLARRSCSFSRQSPSLSRPGAPSIWARSGPCGLSVRRQSREPCPGLELAISSPRAVFDIRVEAPLLRCERDGFGFQRRPGSQALPRCR